MKISSFIIGFLLVIFGLMWFFINFGYGSWEHLMQVSRYWPLLLIIIGATFLLPGEIPRWAALAVVLVVMGLITAYFILGNPAKTASISSLVLAHEEYPEAKQAELDIDYGGGKLLVNPVKRDLLKAQFSGQKAREELQMYKGQLEISLSQAQRSPNLGGATQRWELGISPQLLWKLDVDAGASDAKFDLRGIPIRELDLDTGAGNLFLRMGDNGKHTKVEIDAAASNIKLRIARHTGARIKAEGALRNSNLDELGWIKNGDYYYSPNYQAASSKIDFDIELAVGNLDVMIEDDTEVAHIANQKIA